jgi:membrane-bound inhibitor of C-type lysozyme
MATRLPLIALTLLLAGCQSSPPAPAAATKTLAYTCDDGRLVQAGYPDTDTAELAFGGRTYRLHIAISGSGARYIGDGWQWWSKGTQAWLAPLKPGESYASAQGVSCRAP